MEKTENKELELAEKFIKLTNRNIFLTGKAGTGKTTFLRNLQTITKKKFVITAYTGIAALNAGGVTLNSLFNLPNALFLPEGAINRTQTNVISQAHILNHTNFNPSKLELLTKLELLIIDEVSMLRADLLDMVDLLLKYIRNTPDKAFGGVQLLFIGDLFQLPPVLTDSEQPAFLTYYPSRYFFDANAVRQSKLIYIELKNVYRQKDPYFIELLNKVRYNEIEKADLDELNKKVLNHPRSEQNEMITLTSHINKVNEINTRKLAELSGELFTYPAQITGKFDSKNFPGEAELSIKIGAQVMVTKNDSAGQNRFYNGKIGRVHQISEEGIFVEFNDGSEPVLIQKDSWKNISYGHADEKMIIDTIGELKQFPIRLAWAVTIHKSQGLSFDHAIIDAADSFSEGQVYVALSRLTNFDGLYLLSPISAEILKQSEFVLQFIKECKAEPDPETLLQEEIRHYIVSLLINGYDWKDLLAHLKEIICQIDMWRLTGKFDKLLNIEELARITEQQQATSLKLIRLLTEHFSKPLTDFKYISERVKSAGDYFRSIIIQKLDPLTTHLITTAGKDKDQKEFLNALIKMRGLFEHKRCDFLATEALALGLMNQLSPEELLFDYHRVKTPVINLPAIAHPIIKTGKHSKQVTRQKTYDYFQSGLSIQEIATKRQLAMHVVEGHITELIKQGAIELDEVLSAQKINGIEPLIQNGNVDINELKIKVGDDYSFFELRAALNHFLQHP